MSNHTQILTQTKPKYTIRNLLEESAWWSSSVQSLYLSKTKTFKFYLRRFVCWCKSELPVWRYSRNSYVERVVCLTTTHLIIQNSQTKFSTFLTFFDDPLFRSFTKSKITCKEITLGIHFIFFARHVLSQREIDGTESHWKFCVKIRVFACWRKNSTSKSSRDGY